MKKIKARIMKFIEPFIHNLRLWLKDSYSYPLVTVVVPLYNEERFVKECLESVLSQVYKNWECIIVNDSSTDSSRKIAEEFCEKDKRFSIIDHAVNKGLAGTRNTGLFKAKGEYITFLDADDYILPFSLWQRVLVLHRSSNPYLAGVWSRLITTDEGSLKNTWKLSFQKAPAGTVDFLSTNGDCPFGVHAALVKTKIAVAAGGFREEMRWGAEDWDFWQRVTRNGYIFFCTGYYSGVYRQKKA